MLALRIALLAAVVLGITAEGCANICKKFTTDAVPGCHLNGNGCECVMPFKKTKYKVSMTDSTTGTTGDSGYQGSQNQAGDAAIQALFAHDLGCNCHQNGSVPLGPCTYNAKVCFFFPTVADVANKAPAFNLSVSIVFPVTSPVYSAIAPNATAQGFEAAGIVLAGQIFAAHPQCIPNGTSLAAALSSIAKPEKGI